jgi:hypothetical protein
MRLQRFREPLHANFHPDRQRRGVEVSVRPTRLQERTMTESCNLRAAKQFGGSLVRKRTAAFAERCDRRRPSLASASTQRVTGTILGTILMESGFP